MALRVAEIWNPATGVDPACGMRSTAAISDAILLPDGRCSHRPAVDRSRRQRKPVSGRAKTASVAPPYSFNSATGRDHERARRPVLWRDRHRWDAGSGRDTKVSLIAIGSATHAFDSTALLVAHVHRTSTALAVKMPTRTRAAGYTCCSY